jgi:hypothetical protein
MNKYINIFTITNIVLFISSCSSSNNINSNSNKKQSWIYNAQMPNQICAIGSSTNNLKAKDKALLKAKANISKQLQIYINSKKTKSISCTTKECKTQYKVFSSQQSSQMLNNISIINRYIDNNTNRYYLRACTPKNDDIFEYKNSINYIASKYETTKKSCILQSNYPNKNLSQIKKILVNKAKQNSVEELYGTLVYSNTSYTNHTLTKEKIKSTIVGSVRVKGNPIFYNGENLGEICANITSYITKEDIEKYSPQKVNLKHFCYVNPNMPLKKIKEEAKYKAYIKAIHTYKPSISNISKLQAKNLIHGFEVSNDGFDFSSGAYCFDAKVTLLPYELEIKNISRNNNSNDIQKLQSGLIATFYNTNDINFNNPLYSTKILSLNLEYKKLPYNKIIKKNKLYTILIQGYIKSSKNQHIKIQMYDNVYNAKFYINDNFALSTHKKTNTIKLKKGFNKLNLIVTTANGYDIKIINNNGILEDLYTKK